MSRQHVIASVLALLHASQCQRMGPFDVLVRTFDYCGPKSGEVFIVDSHIRKYNRTVFVIDGTAHILSELDDSVKASAELAVFTSNGWKENFFRSEFPGVCGQIKIWIWQFFVSLMKAANLPAKCPVQKGNYTVKGFPLSIDISNKIPAFYYNKYKWKFHLYKSNRLYSCFQAIVDVVPKKKN